MTYSRHDPEDLPWSPIDDLSFDDLPGIDLGCHVYHSVFDETWESMLRRARKHGVLGVVIPGITPEAIDPVAKSAAIWPGFLYATIGVHPHAAERWSDGVANDLRALAAQDAVVAIGECGLARDRDLSRMSRQLRAFDGQLGLASESGLPLYLVAPQALDETLDRLEPHRFDLDTIVIRDFAGTLPELDRCLELGLYIGFSGRIAHPGHRTHFCELIRRVPLERLVACTDAPFQVPRGLPTRVGTNESAMLAWIIGSIAEARDDDPQALAEVMLRNARSCLRIDDVTLRKPWHEE